MPLNQNKLKKVNDFNKFITFTSLRRQFSRSIHTFFSLFRLATKAACLFTGLFLCPYLNGSNFNGPDLGFKCGRLGGRTNHNCDIRKERGRLQATRIRFKMSFHAFDDLGYQGPTVGGYSSLCHFVG